MERNTLLAIILSFSFLAVWYLFIQKPAPRQAPAPAAVQQQQQQQPSAAAPAAPELKTAPAASATEVMEREIVVETPAYKAVFTNRGAAVKHWYLKEKDGSLTDLVMQKNVPILSTFPGSNYTVSQPEPRKLVFTYVSPQGGWQIVKTYNLSDQYLHGVTIQTIAGKDASLLSSVSLDLGPGLGTDERNEKDNLSQIRALGYTKGQGAKLEKFKPGEFNAADFQWVAIDNRYFLASLIPQGDTTFTTASVYRSSKKQPVGLTLTANIPKDRPAQTYTLQLYMGPKGRDHLTALGLHLEETIDFGFFGFLGKIALSVLLFLHKITGNYGWAVILLTLLIQIIVLPLSIKSFKASAAMKQLQPKIKELQEKFKNDPQRLNMEMLNLYRTQKVNPFGGCLPMLLQLPIFWALFTTLRNAIELRGAPWILWVKDLSAPDTLFHVAGLPINILPLIMGVGMFVQQKMMSVSTDPTQEKMMLLMPVIFTFMFWGFPAGLVLYWLTNSILAMIEQYYILRQPAGAPAR